MSANQTGTPLPTTAAPPPPSPPGPAPLSDGVVAMAVIAPLTLLTCIAVVLILRRKLQSVQAYRPQLPDDREGSPTPTHPSPISIEFNDDESEPGETDTRPLSAKEKAVLDDACLHMHTETPGGILPGCDVAGFPRGPGTAWVGGTEEAVRRTAEGLAVQAALLWYTKKGDVLDELLANLRFPDPARARVVLKELLPRMYGAVPDDPGSFHNTIAPLQHFVLRLVTHEGIDTDRLLLFDDAPVWVEGNEAGRLVWNCYRDEHSASRNPATYEAIDRAGERVLQTRYFGERDEALMLMKQWVKCTSLMSALCEHMERHAEAGGITREGQDLYRALVGAKPFEKGEWVCWASPIACTPNYEAVEQFATLNAATLLVFHGAGSRYVPVKGQYLYEETMLLPAFTVGYVESVHEKGGMRVVDVLIKDNHPVDPHLARYVLQDAWGAEERVAQTIEEVRTEEMAGGGELGGPVAEYTPVGVVHCPMHGERKPCLSTEASDFPWCYECGAPAHGLHPVVVARLSEAHAFKHPKGVSSSEVPAVLHVEGSNLIEGEYHLHPSPIHRLPAWSNTTKGVMLAVSNASSTKRWAFKKEGHTVAVSVSNVVNSPIRRLLPFHHSRWALRNGGEWVEDAAVVVNLAPPPPVVPDLPHEDFFEIPLPARRPRRHPRRCVSPPRPRVRKGSSFSSMTPTLPDVDY
eukprot:Sspe_Gene.13637::Locus_4679_Transcript_1_1_Confidence_1.000_Length_2435::g.13637::m.13637